MADLGRPDKRIHQLVCVNLKSVQSRLLIKEADLYTWKLWPQFGQESNWVERLEREKSKENSSNSLTILLSDVGKK